MIPIRPFSSSKCSIFPAAGDDCVEDEEEIEASNISKGMTVSRAHHIILDTVRNKVTEGQYTVEGYALSC